MAQRRETLQRIIEQLSIGDVHNPPLEVTIHMTGVTQYLVYQDQIFMIMDGIVSLDFSYQLYDIYV